MHVATTDRILDRVRKLLALSERAGTPEEAGTAFATAQKLIAQHALSEEQIRQARIREVGGRPDEPVLSRMIWTAQGGGGVPTWVAIIAGVLCDVNGCDALVYRSSASVKAWGRASDLDLVAELLGAVVGQIDAMAARCPAAKGRTGKNNYRLGAAQVVCERLRQAASEARRAIEATAAEQDASAPATAREVTALALRALDDRVAVAAGAMRAEVAAAGSKIRSARTARSSYDGAARNAGRADGARVNLSRGRALGGC